MKVVVFTGATSFLGTHLLEKLLNKGYAVYALVRKNSARLKRLPASDRLILLYGSLDDLELVREKVAHADLWIHFAWQGSVGEDRTDREIQNGNVEYSMRALEIADELGCKEFVFSGSQAEYGKKDSETRENMACAPVSEYGRAKLAFSRKAEEYCEKREIKFIHLRIFSVYGPGDRQGSLVSDCIRKFNHGQKMDLGSCVQKWNYLYIDDFAAMVMRLINSDCEAGIYNIGSDDTRVLREYVLQIYEMSNKSGSYEFGDTYVNPEGSPSLRPDISKLLTVIGDFKMTPFEEGIHRIMDATEFE